MNDQKTLSYLCAFSQRQGIHSRFFDLIIVTFIKHVIAFRISDIFGYFLSQYHYQVHHVYNENEIFSC